MLALFPDAGPCALFAVPSGRGAAAFGASGALLADPPPGGGTEALDGNAIGGIDRPLALPGVGAADCFVDGAPREIGGIDRLVAGMVLTGPLWFAGGFALFGTGGGGFAELDGSHVLLRFRCRFGCATHPLDAFGVIAPRPHRLGGRQRPRDVFRIVGLRVRDLRDVEEIVAHPRIRA